MLSRSIYIQVIILIAIPVVAASGSQPAGDPLEMVTVPAGSFAFQNKTIVFVDTFKIDKYEITNNFYCRFLNEADPCGLHFDSQMQIARTGTLGKYQYSVKSGMEQFPICFANALDAEAFAAWRSKTYSGAYSLPTERQWEKAAGWDPVLKKMFTYGFHSDVIDKTWCNYDNPRGPMPVGSFNGTDGRKDAKSYYGCYDMSGNVWEWTSTPYDRQSRVIRGCSFWSDEDEFCAVTARGNSYPLSRADDIGLRLVLKPEKNMPKK